MHSTPRRIHPTWSWLFALQRLCDAAGVLAGLGLGLWSIGMEAPTDQQLLAGVTAAIVFLLAGEFSGLYRSWRGASADRELWCVLGTWAAALLVLSILGVLTGHTPLLRRRMVLVWMIAAPTVILATRLATRAVLKHLRARGMNSRRFAIIGVNELAFQLARNMEAAPELGLRLIGLFDDRPAERVPAIPADVGPRVGDIAELVEMARSGQVDLVYITFPMRAEERIRGVLERLADSTASVYIVPDFFVFELLHSRWTNLGGLPVVSVFENPFYGVDGLVKRVVDLVVTSLLLVLLALPMTLIALLIKLTSPGPVFFRQKRYGLDGREIRVWKFRSMTVCEDGPQVAQARKHDSRVTPLGAVLRKTSLDELPQLFNVLEGSMSLVGPRPHATAHNEAYRKQIPGYMLRHKVKPGITGLAQVNGWRGETDTLEKMERRIACDHQYIREWSLWMDIKILVKTVWVVCSRQNAY